MSSKTKVLLTGVTGFLGSHTTIQLLEKGYEVTGTLRDMKRAEAIRKMVAAHTDHAGNLHFEEADLTDRTVWEKLTKDVQYVQHIASPFPRTLPKKEEELVRPAVDGTLHVLKAAVKNGVKRVVLTSSSGAIMYGKKKEERHKTFDEKDWTDTGNVKDSTPYFRSKTLAEKAAWDFIEGQDPETELSTVCPGAILGPVLENDFGTSANIVIKIMDGSTPAVPNIGFDMVDVRSVAALLIKVMESPKAANQRYVGSAGFMRFKEVAQILKQAYPERKIPTTSLPNFAVRLFSRLDPSLKPILIDLGTARKLSNAKARKELNWEPLPNKEAILSCAQSVLDLGLVK